MSSEYPTMVRSFHLCRNTRVSVQARTNAHPPGTTRVARLRETIRDMYITFEATMTGNGISLQRAGWTLELRYEGLPDRVVVDV